MRRRGNSSLGSTRARSRGAPKGKQSERNQPKGSIQKGYGKMLISKAYDLGAIDTARAYAHSLTECERR